MIITKHNAFMRITSKILEENLIFLGTIQSYARIGKAVLLLHVMKKVVNA